MFGKRREPKADLDQAGALDRGGAAPLVLLGQAQALPLPVQPVGAVGLVALGGLELGVQEGLELGHHVVDLLGGGHALLDQAGGVEFAGGGVVLDLGVHQGLGHRGVVPLVVPVAAVAEDVEDGVLAELLPVFDRDPRGVDHRFGVVAVDVQDGCLDHQRNVGRIGRRAAVPRRRGEADLVVDDHVDRPAGPVALQPHQREALRHHALARERRVAVQQQRQHLLAPAFGVLAQVEGLLGPRLAQHDRVDDLQVAGVGGQRQVDGVAVELAVGAGAQMVLHVARAGDVGRHRRAALKLVEDDVVRLAHHRRQRVQPPAVRHADDDLVHAQRAAALDDLLQRRHHGLAAVQAEALGPGEAAVQEPLERLRLDQLGVDRQLALAGEADLLVPPFDPLLDPGLLRRIVDVHVLHAHVAAVGPAHDRQDLPDARGLQPQNAVEEDRPVHVRLGEPVVRRVQLRVAAPRLQAERVQVRRQVAADAIGADHHDRAHAVVGGRADRLGRGFRGSRLDGDGGLLLDRGPQPVERGQGVGAGDGGRPRPGGVRHGRADGRRVVVQALEEGAPVRGDRSGVRGPLRLKLLHEAGVAAVEEAGFVQHLGDASAVVRHDRSRTRSRIERPARSARDIVPRPLKISFPARV
jgi:hypothetical protein